MLKAGFIGFGRMGITHFAILNTHPAVKVVAMSDPSSIMQSILKKYVAINVYSDYQTMLDNEELDFVVISTPPDSHSEIIHKAIDKNIAFFIEKPLSLSFEESNSIVDRIKSSPKNITNQVGYVNRFCETFTKVKSLLAENVIGEIKTFSSEMYSATVLKDSSSGWRGKKKAGGGCLYEMTSHAVDLAVYLFGAPSFVKGSVVQGVYSTEIEDLVSTTLVYENGCTGRIVVNWSDASFRKPGNTITINGMDGKIIVSKYTIKIFMINDSPKFNLKKGWNTIYLTDISDNVPYYLRGNEFTNQLYDFVEHCTAGTPTRSECRDSAITDGILAAITRDAERNILEPLFVENQEATASIKSQKSFFEKIFTK